MQKRRARLVARVSMLALLLTLLLSMGWAAPRACATPTINEVLASTTGTDVEYIEIYGAPGASLAGLSLIYIEANNRAREPSTSASIFRPAIPWGRTAFS